MKKNTSNQDEKSIGMFLEAINQVPNIFEGIVQQDKLPMTKEEQKLLDYERMNYWDYEYVLSGAYIEGFCFGTGIDPRSNTIPEDLLKRGRLTYNHLKPTATHPMNQEKRNLFANDWLERSVLYATEKGAFLHGYREGEKYKMNLEMSKQLKEAGVSPEIIMKVTGLTAEKIKK